MKDFAGKVAVVTGAASGMGLAFATRFAQEGMKVVLADIEAEPLAMAEAAIKAAGGSVLSVRTDVMKEDDIKRLADTAFGTFGNVHILCNNAGVAGAGFTPGSWNVPMVDWDWVLGVNFMGVLHGIRHFVPRMVANDEEGHIVNTASVAGLLTGAAGLPYSVSKHGVVVLTEQIYREFKTMGLKLSASVLCPGMINTNILDSVRNRPAELTPPDSSPLPMGAAERMDMVRAIFKTGIQPEEVAEKVFEAVRDDTFYVIPAQENIVTMIDTRLEDIRLRRNPTLGGIFG